MVIKYPQYIHNNTDPAPSPGTSLSRGHAKGLSYNAFFFIHDFLYRCSRTSQIAVSFTVIVNVRTIVPGF